MAEWALANTCDRAYSASLSFLNALRPLFYLEPPSQSSFEEIKDVPNYLDKVCPTSWSSDISNHCNQ